MHNLSRQHEDTYKAYQWLMQNRDKFRGKIHGPILLQLQLKDRRYADIVESVLGGERGSHLRVDIFEGSISISDTLTNFVLDICLRIQGGLRAFHQGNSRQATFETHSILARQD